jgi:hypothetical protein
MAMGVGGRGKAMKNQVHMERMGAPHIHAQRGTDIFPLHGTYYDMSILRIMPGGHNLELAGGLRAHRSNIP